MGVGWGFRFPPWEGLGGWGNTHLPLSIYATDWENRILDWIFYRERIYEVVNLYKERLRYARVWRLLVFTNLIELEAISCRIS